jgi:DNA-binding CsgD family transcriptional regulator
MAEETQAEDIVAHALTYRGVARASLGDDDGIADLERAIEVAGRTRHADFETVASHNLASVLLRVGRVAEAEPYLEHAGRVAREYNLDVALFRIEAQLCLCLLLRGDWDEAERRLRDLLAGGADPGANAVNPLSFLGRILARRGDPGAADLVERAWRLAVATGEDQKISVAGGARIEWLWLTEDAATVRAEAEELLRVVLRAQHRWILAEVLRYLRRVGVAVQPFPGCPPAFAAGMTGQWAVAARLWDEAGNPYERALELSESEDPGDVREALALLDRLGATGTGAILRRRLRQAGVPGVPRGPRNATRADPGLLTQRQRDVLALVAQGLTNAEIADRLVLSRRTVDNHVAAVLQRLGVTSRREAARAVNVS